MAGVGEVRVEESLRVKIGEAKNLPANSGSPRNTFCAIRLDLEEIYRTTTVEKSLDPYFGEEFAGEIPKKFRTLSVLLYEVVSKSEKVLGKVSIKKDELYKYHQKEHWFPLAPSDAESDVQGKVHLEIRFDEYLSSEPDFYSSHRMAVRVVECSDLMVVNGACNPYAVVVLSWGKLRHKEVKRTVVRKKTICPQFDDVFCFDLNNKGQNHDRNIYSFDDIYEGELSVSLWHDDSKVSREVLGHMFRGSFLGEVKILLRDLDLSTVHTAWYCLQAREMSNKLQPLEDLGSIRLKISYTADYVFESHYYHDLRELLLASADVKPVSSSAAFLLGEIADTQQEAAQPLVRLFVHYEKILPFIRSLADWEMSHMTDPNTLFRGNTLLSKMLDELMKLVGLPYLHDTLRAFIDNVCDEPKSCEIDSTRIKDGENHDQNLENLKSYVKSALEAITASGLVCPTLLRDVFCVLKEMALKHYPDNPNVRYHAITSFIFLRFFAPAILGPRLFELRSEAQDPVVVRALTLISKAITSLANIVTSKSANFGLKEEYMVPLLDALSTEATRESIKMFLDIISATGAYAKNIEAPITLKEGLMIKRAQGRKRLGLKNFKKRYFCLTNQFISYAKSKLDKPLCVIPVEDVLAVERLQEDSFRMKYMFQVVQKQRALYVQASNCVEEKEWLDILTKVCKSNKNRLKEFHPAAFINSHWLCCKSVDPNAKGCSPVTGGVPVTDIQVDIDPDRELEKIHSLFLAHMDKLDALQDVCGSQVVYAGVSEELRPSIYVEDPQTCFQTVSELQKCVVSLEQEHKQYLRMVQRSTVIGSREAPIGDDSCGFPFGSKSHL
ncbi:ras GTPase-activating protein 3-like isoform X2 [Pomacea canaliculata]|uniref:ras GTPase-activating protein 3-like isoform X2 n=1 Tax=Pomacea canaliculata TaxID=400727 RepID=UPI000D72CB55|nr:ras GTPase-activating protein 3-like isoform X2 [Pomacea canaliculata]